MAEPPAAAAGEPAEFAIAEGDGRTGDGRRRDGEGEPTEQRRPWESATGAAIMEGYGRAGASGGKMKNEEDGATATMRWARGGAIRSWWPNFVLFPS